MPLTALPYYFFYGRDLVQTGYGCQDLLRVYALNMLLIPVNLGGVFKSIQQGWTGRQIPFKRTPKVSGRTAAPAVYVALEMAIVLYCLVGASVDLVHHRWVHSALALFNAAIFLYAIHAFIGFQSCWEDFLQGVRKGRRSTTATRSLELFPARVAQ